MNQVTTEPYVTIARAARELGIAPWLLRKLVFERVVPYVVIGGRKRVRVSEVYARIMKTEATA